MLCRARTAGVQAASAAVEVHSTTMACPAAAASCSFPFRSGAPRLITPRTLFLTPTSAALESEVTAARCAAAGCSAGTSTAAAGAA